MSNLSSTILEVAVFGSHWDTGILTLVWEQTNVLRKHIHFSEFDFFLGEIILAIVQIAATHSCLSLWICLVQHHKSRLVVTGMMCCVSV